MKHLLFFPALLICVVIFCVDAVAQKQLVLLKNQKVVKRFRPGDEFVFRIKGSKDVKRTYVNNLSDTAVVTHRDIIPFRKIDRIYFRRQTRGNVIGGAFVVGGAALFLIDQLNHTVIQGNEASLNGGVSTASLAAIGVGLPLMLFKKNYQRIRYPYRLRTVDKTSVFYQPEVNSFVIPSARE